MSSPRTGTDSRLDALTSLAEATALEAAELLRSALERTDLAVSTKSTGTDMVTEMDRASEQLISERILTERSDDGMLGEEGTDVEGSSGVRWIVDPLDGTTNYLYGHTGCNVSIAAEVDGELAIGVVVDVLPRSVFVGQAGVGATRDGKPIPQLPDPPRLSGALVATGFGYEPTRRRAQAELLGRVIGEIRDIRRVGAAAVDLCSVASRRVDAFYERGLAPWDLAAGTVIARSCGALVTDLDGGDPGADFVIAAHPVLHAELTELLLRESADRLP